MEWIPFTDYEKGMNMEDKPKKLAPEEIAYITGHLPSAPSADSTAAEVSRQSIVNWMTETLSEVSLCPSAIPELIEIIVKQHNKSLVIPGTPVGITAAEAVGATTTQMTLNTFHASGSSKSASFGIDAMRDLIFARKNPKNESCTIYFKNQRSAYEKVLDSRSFIVGSVVSDFILRDGAIMAYDIDTPTNLERFWWHDQAPFLLNKELPHSTKVLRLFLNIPEMYKHHVSIRDLADVLEREVPASVIAVYGPIGDGIIDLYPHPALINETMKNHGMTALPTELAELAYLESVVRPELDKIRVKGISGIKNLVPIISPVWRMVIHERKLMESDINDQVREQLSPGLVNKSGWLLFYNTTIMRNTGLIPENLAALCQAAGLTILGGTKLWLAINMPADRFRTALGEVIVEMGGIKHRRLDKILRHNGLIYRELSSDNFKEVNGVISEKIDDKMFVVVPEQEILRVDGSVYRLVTRPVELGDVVYEVIHDQPIKITEMKPNEYIAAKVTVDKRERQKEIKRRTDVLMKTIKGLPDDQRKEILRRPIDEPRTPLMIAAEFVFAETDGSNLKELLALPEIDKTRTTCNNMYTITKTLGIEAARTFVIRALANTIANTGSYVHPANIMFIAEFITSRGEPYGATYTGISRQPGGHLSLATLERAGKVFTQNALHGRKEDIRNVSASVAVGARMAIGNGSFDIGQDIVENGVQKTIINDDLFNALERDDVTRQEAINRIAGGEGQTIPLEDLTGGIDMIKNLTLGGTFDDVGAEDETNLITLFNPGEAIPEITAPRQQTVGQTKVVRRVQGIQGEQARPVTEVPPKIEVPRELVDVLTQIKIGVPLPEGQEAEVLTIKPIQMTVATPQPTEEVISKGLIPLEELFYQTIAEGFPQQLQELFDNYDRDTGVTPEALPRVEIPQLPDLTDVDFDRIMIEMRREQLRELKPIDTEALQAALQQ